ncbi:hypothetical protein B4U80_09274 [Leptotrombidium deliense]|uniref:Uncharacterized protein n=1 Tax=Leptotrombidium deliense TaxID=299467 RepID=A0A443RT48_9ACAR|nr:hypothetical protein B4U80_09274 [Leptotrombidium deliense]
MNCYISWGLNMNIIDLIEIGF